MRIRMLFIWMLVLAMSVAGVGIVACDDDDDDDDDDNGDDDDTDDDDDDDAAGAPPEISGVTDLPDTDDATGPYLVETTVTDDLGIDSVSLFYRTGDGEFTELAMDQTKAGYAAGIPGHVAGSLVEYYVSATDSGGQTVTDPEIHGNVYDFWVLESHDIIYDDWTAEEGETVSDPGSFTCVQFTPPSYPAYLTTFSYYVDYVQPTSEVQPYVIYDADAGDPPDPAGAIALADPFAETELDSIVELDISEVAELATPLESGDFYLCFMNMNSNYHRFGFDTDSPLDRTWIWWSGNSTWINLENDYAIIGQLMFRASVLAP